MTRSTFLRLSVAGALSGALLVPLAGVSAGAAESAGRAGPTPTWGPIHELAANPWGGDLAADGLGRVIATWGTGSYPHTVWAAVRRADGTWAAPNRLGRGLFPKIAADARGDVTIVWQSVRDGYTDGARAVTRRAHGDWSSPVALTRERKAPDYVPGVDGYLGAGDVDVTMSPAGFAVATWVWGSDYLDKPYRVRAATRTPSGAWSDPVAITGPNGCHAPEAAAISQHRAVVVYANPGDTRLRARRLVDGVWSPSDRIAKGEAVGMAADRDGITTVAFTSRGNRVRVVTAAPEGPWSTPTTVFARGKPIDAASFDGTTTGAATLAVARDGGHVSVARRTAAGSWVDPVMMTGPPDMATMVVARLNRRGDAFVAWGYDGAYGRYRPVAGPWTEPMTISPQTHLDVLEGMWAAVLPNGDVAVLWDQEGHRLKIRIMHAD